MTEKITIVITMAGLSKRFSDAGYFLPKYMLDLSGKTVFEHAIMSFKSYFKSNNFIFICREVNETSKFVYSKCAEMSILSYQIYCLNDLTKGQAETTLIGLEGLKCDSNRPILIFNIDTFRPGYVFPPNIDQWDGYLEVFTGSGTNWSYVKPYNELSTRVIETAEKKEISNLCSTGMYYFRSFNLFKEAYLNYYSKLLNTEHYIAPIYNSLTSNHKDVHYHMIDRENVIFCGTPDEYKELKGYQYNHG